MLLAALSNFEAALPTAEPELSAQPIRPPPPSLPARAASLTAQCGCGLSRYPGAALHCVVAHLSCSLNLNIIRSLGSMSPGTRMLGIIRARDFPDSPFRPYPSQDVGCSQSLGQSQFPSGSQAKAPTQCILITLLQYAFGLMCVTAYNLCGYAHFEFRFH